MSEQFLTRRTENTRLLPENVSSGTNALAVSGLEARAATFAEESRAKSTLRTYRSVWRSFALFCEQCGADPVPSAQAACAYAVWLADRGRKVATIMQAMAALEREAKHRGMPPLRSSSELQAVLAGIRRKLGVAHSEKVALSVPDMRAMVERLPKSLRGARDRALLLVGYAGAFRRSELAAVRVEDLTWTEEGVRIAVGRSKTDQEGKGKVKAIPRGQYATTCPVRALRAWLDSAGITSGPVFVALGAGGLVTHRALAPQQVARIVQSCARSIGLDASVYGGHSLRAGLITAAARAHKSEWSIMRQSGHASPAQLAKYVREAQLFADNAASGIGL